MKILLSALLATSLFSAEVVKVDKKYQKSQNCKACHLPIVKEWNSSWHAKSHYKNDEYFRATTDYVKRKSRKSLNSIKVQCATCHNPRISVTSTDMEYEIDTLMGLNKGSKVDRAVNSDAISEGINCVVCHNIDKIHNEANATLRGINRVEWTKSGLMSGPFDDASSPYHNVQHREFMGKESDKLCFVCHANDRALGGLKFIDMQSEYKKDDKGCVDCHMGSKREGVAATLPIDHGVAKKRDIRTHLFKGAHTKTLWRDALGLTLKSDKKNLYIEIANQQPHNIPSGFGARELVVDIIYYDDMEVVHKETLSLTRHYTSKRGKPTIPHLAVEATEDLSIPAKGERIFVRPLFTGSSHVEVRLYYRLVNDEVRELLQLESTQWSQKSFIASKTLQL